MVDICEKFGELETLTLKTKIQNGEVVSRGIAIAQFATKEQAAEAIKKLPFENKLGPDF